MPGEKKIPSAQKLVKFWVLEKKVLDPAQTGRAQMEFQCRQELLPVSKDPDTGLVRLELNGKSGTICVWYGKTTMQTVSKWISLLSLLLIVAFGVIQFLTKYKSGRENTDTQYI